MGANKHVSFRKEDVEEKIVSKRVAIRSRSPSPSPSDEGDHNDHHHHHHHHHHHEDVLYACADLDWLSPDTLSRRDGGREEEEEHVDVLVKCGFLKEKCTYGVMMISMTNFPESRPEINTLTPHPNITISVEREDRALELVSTFDGRKRGTPTLAGGVEDPPEALPVAFLTARIAAVDPGPFHHVVNVVAAGKTLSVAINGNVLRTGQGTPQMRPFVKILGSAAETDVEH